MLGIFHLIDCANATMISTVLISGCILILKVSRVERHTSTDLVRSVWVHDYHASTVRDLTCSRFLQTTLQIMLKLILCDPSHPKSHST